MLVISIVPRLFPAIDGVGDYALQLAQQLRKDFDIETHFIVGDPNWSSSTEIDGFPINKIAIRSAATLSSLLLNCCQGSTKILLHYVGHGYAEKGGCPIWLVRSLEDWKTKVVNAQLVTMFHELYAFNPPWRRNFWSFPLQQNLTTRLSRLSDRCLTNRQNNIKVLYKFSQGKHTQIPNLPVFSNIGEPDKVPSLVERQRRLVVFGQEKSRLRVYRESLGELSKACQILGIEEVWDIGPSINLSLASVGEVPIVRMGERPAPEISNMMLKSIAGFLNYDPNLLAKSGIFAAYCSHGLVPISYRAGSRSLDGIKARENYWVPDDQSLAKKPVEELQAIADNAYTWYQNHKLSLQANTFAIYLADNLQR